MVLVCINRRSPACAAVRNNRRFCVNVLARTQSEMADRFAGRPTTGKAYEFHAGSWKGSATGSPVLDGGIASFDCALERVINAGTHTIFIGTVKAVESSSKSPLVYTDGTYRRTGRKA